MDISFIPHLARLAAGLGRLGFAVAPCEGTYFLTADYAPLGIEDGDGELCRRMTVEAVLNNSFGFGGHNASILAKRFVG